jgi:hypothetical protein
MGRRQRQHDNNRNRRSEKMISNTSQHDPKVLRTRNEVAGLSELSLLFVLAVLWLGIAWVILRRVGFFGAHKPPRFSVEQDGRHFASGTSTYLINGVLGGRHIVYVFASREGDYFVYMPRDRDIRVLPDRDALETFVRENCGGEKGMAKLRHDAAKRVARK